MVNAYIIYVNIFNLLQLYESECSQTDFSTALTLTRFLRLKCFLPKTVLKWGLTVCILEHVGTLQQTQVKRASNPGKNSANFSAIF